MRIAAPFVLVSVLMACAPSAPTSAPAQSTATASGAGAGTNAITPAADAASEFEAAAGNVGCHYVPSGGTETYQTPDGGPELICDRVEPTYLRFSLSAHGAARRYDQVGDASCCGGEMLAAGAHWSAGPFACDVTQDGVACANADRRGFTLSRSEVRAN
jgi:hypothetical protein